MINFLKKREIIMSFIIFCIVFATSLFTLADYNVNWDEAAVHFARGQSILHYLMTGKIDYSDLKNSGIRISYYQNDSLTYDFFEKNFQNRIFIGVGHPPLSDLIASVSNRIFYGWLNILGDVEAYHLYSVFLGAVLVSVVYYFVATRYSLFSGIIAALSLELYPLFLGESRYNTKDVPEAVFLSFAILSLYKAILSNSIKWIFFSSLFFAFAFGTKFNVLFLPFIILPWLVVYFIYEIKKIKLRAFLKKRWKLLLSFSFYPIVGIIIFFAVWPNLWPDPIDRFSFIVNYYKRIGTSSGFDPRFLIFFRINTYAIQWITYTTPIMILILSSVGILAASWRVLFKKDKISLLILLWLIVPIARVTVPNANIYGGVRQIMEYVPAMAILAGIGAGYIVILLNKYIVKNLLILQILIIFAFIPITLRMISMHPNESVYFNSIIGGLKGAKENNIPGWGVSLGSTYRQGIAWLNKYAEKNAKLALVFELGGNINATDLRPDITLYNQVRSGIRREGEYAIGVTHDGTLEYYYYRRYLERFLNPVYELKVEGVSILKIWKNDAQHTKPEYLKKEQEIINPILKSGEKELTVDLGQVRRITKIEVNYNSTSCTKPTDGYFQISKDGKSWERIMGSFTGFYSMRFILQPEPGKLNFIFAGDEARFIRLMINDNNSCLLIYEPQITVWHI